MAKLLVICGTGVATSTVVVGKVRTWLEENGIQNSVQLFQGKVAEELTHLDDYDVVLSTTIVPDNVKDRVINGVPLLLGIGTEAVWQELRTRIDAANS